jgi:drug/metabolite transporter (DMT)-like permease
VTISQKKHATLGGGGALLIWAFSPLIILHIVEIPPFQLLALGSFFAFVFSGIFFRLRMSRSLFRQPPVVWLMALFGNLGANALYVLALHSAPPAHVDIINYLWPILVVIISSFLPGERFYKRYLTATFLGFIGMMTLFFEGERIVIENRYILGYLIAVVSAFSWTAYMLIARFNNKKMEEILPFQAMVGCIGALVLHIMCEKTVIPPLSSYPWVMAYGAGALCMTYVLWNHGVTYGNFRLLSVLSYGNHILSLSLLILCGYAELKSNLVLSCCMVTFGAFIASQSTERYALLRRRVAALYSK